jgi:hypothetical protein
MIEIILKRKPIRDFLKNYSSERWTEIIPNVLEIGVLNLKNSFGTYQFSQEDFQSILYDLYNYNHRPNPKESKETRERSECNHKGQIYQTKETYREDFDNKTNRNSASNRRQPICDKKSSRSNTEVFVMGDQELQKKHRMNSQNCRNKHYNIMHDLPKGKNDKNKRNIESKIKSQVANDKYIHKVLNNPKRNENNNNNQYQTNSGNNYKINYDKNLQPESIYDKENQMYYYDIQDGSNYDKYNYSYPTTDISYRETQGNKLNYGYNEISNNYIFNKNTHDYLRTNNRNNSDFKKCYCCSRNDLYSPGKYYQKDSFSVQNKYNFNNTPTRTPTTNCIDDVYKTVNYKNVENKNNFDNNMIKQKKGISKSNSKSDFNYKPNKDKLNENQQMDIEQNNDKLNASKDSEEQLTSSQRIKFLFKREVVNWKNDPISDDNAKSE